MTLDADVAAALEALLALDAPALSQGTVAEARANYDAAPKPRGDDVSRVEDLVVPGPAGDVPVRVYAASDAENLP
ncbi:MAG: hypothetical protein KDB16_19910, partial [Acidimicrobiales bacterium]|nr:hypothetical protein [Acidimicrobiales bacterium]